VHCLRRDTQFITSAGVRSFEDFQPGDEVIVRSHTGKWRPAKVVNHGPAPLFRHTFRRKGGINQLVWATAGHRWLTSQGVMPSQKLPPRAILQAPPEVFAFDYAEAPPDERLWWIYGFVFGDGTVALDSHGKPKYSLVRLDGEEKVRFRPRFEEMGFKISEP